MDFKKCGITHVEKVFHRPTFKNGDWCWDMIELESERVTYCFEPTGRILGNLKGGHLFGFRIIRSEGKEIETADVYLSEDDMQALMNNPECFWKSKITDIEKTYTMDVIDDDIQRGQWLCDTPNHFS